MKTALKIGAWSLIALACIGIALLAYVLGRAS
jgi:hypothetical protein